MGKVSIDVPGSTFVQQATLEKLKCMKCKRYLSVLPIFKNPSGEAICGRCPVDSALNFTRDELYECAIEFQKFPCTNRERGCLEVMFPVSLGEHEKRCFYMKHECPTRIYNNCTWQGNLSNLIGHFEKEHPTFIMSDGNFEIDFVNSHNENYLMPYCEDWYVVTREANPGQGIFSIAVNYLGSNTDVDKYVYDLTLESGTKPYKYSLQQNMGKRLEINRQLVNEKLHEPITVVANIFIKEGSNAFVNSDLTDADDDSLDSANLRIFECIVCMQYMLPPIYQCETGHDVCHVCKEDLKNCPTCTASFGKTRNFALENLALDKIYPCKHVGCKFRTKARNIRQHQASCLFGPFICPLKEYENCSMVFPVSQLFDHIKNAHYESLLQLDTVSVPFDQSIEQDINEGYLLKHSQFLFKICFKYGFAEKKFYWSVQLIGPPEESAKYNYELEIIDTTGKALRMHLKSNCISQTNQTETFQNLDNYVYLHYDQISKLIKNQIIYRILITNKL